MKTQRDSCRDFGHILGMQLTLLGLAVCCMSSFISIASCVSYHQERLLNPLKISCKTSSQKRCRNIEKVDSMLVSLCVVGGHPKGAHIKEDFPEQEVLLG